MVFGHRAEALSVDEYLQFVLVGLPENSWKFNLVGLYKFFEL